MKAGANTWPACMATVAVFLGMTVAAGATRRVAAQDPVEEVRLATAGPRFLALDTGRSSDAPRPWKDASEAAVFRQRISLHLQDVPLGDALSEIARKAGLRLTYSAAVVRLETPVTFSASSLTVGAVLSAVLYDAGVDVLLTSGGQAALVRRGAFGDLQLGAIAGRVTDSLSGQGGRRCDGRGRGHGTERTVRGRR
jgi:hypothetical protein